MYKFRKLLFIENTLSLMNSMQGIVYKKSKVTSHLYEYLLLFLFLKIAAFVDLR